MPVRKGYTNNPYRRPKGSPNRTTAEVREVLVIVFNTRLNALQKNLAGMDPVHQVDFLFRLLPYIVPILNPINPESTGPAEYQDEMFQTAEKLFKNKRNWHRPGNENKGHLEQIHFKRSMQKKIGGSAQMNDYI